MEYTFQLVSPPKKAPTTASTPSPSNNLLIANAEPIIMHKCPQCPAAFKRKEHLTRHKLIHTGLRPFVCNYPGCKKGFNRLDNLKQHCITHFPGKVGKAGKKGQVDFNPLMRQSARSGLTLPAEFATPLPEGNFLFIMEDPQGLEENINDIACILEDELAESEESEETELHNRKTDLIPRHHAWLDSVVPPAFTPKNTSYSAFSPHSSTSFLPLAAASQALIPNQENFFNEHVNSAVEQASSDETLILDTPQIPTHSTSTSPLPSPSSSPSPCYSPDNQDSDRIPPESNDALAHPLPILSSPSVLPPQLMPQACSSDCLPRFEMDAMYLKLLPVKL